MPCASARRRRSPRRYQSQAGAARSQVSQSFEFGASRPCGYCRQRTARSQEKFAPFARCRHAVVSVECDLEPRGREKGSAQKKRAA